MRGKWSLLALRIAGAQKKEKSCDWGIDKQPQIQYSHNRGDLPMETTKAAERLNYGIAEYTPFIQAWLNSCPAVIDYRETTVKSRPVLEFTYDESIEVLNVPAGVNFS
jgi:hypothetical protein